MKKHPKKPRQRDLEKRVWEFVREMENEGIQPGWESFDALFLPCNSGKREFKKPSYSGVYVFKPEKMTAIIDTREQTPVKLLLKKDLILKSEPGTLYSGDYSVKGLEKSVAIERKSLEDMLGCIGRDRERFEREVTRLKGYEVKGIVVESTWQQIESGMYRSRVKPSAAIGSLMGWIASGIPVTMAGDHERAGIFIARMLYISAKRKYEQLKHLA